MAGELMRECRTVSFAAEKNHDRLGSDFEKAWLDGNQPRLEEWLERVPEDERPVLFLMLAKRERALRAGDCTPDEFRRRFPGYASWVDSIFETADTAFEFVEDSQAAPLPSIPGYRVLDRIASGGMGVVYKAVQTGLERTVALKMVRSSSMLKEDEIARFRVEARAVAGVLHPNIIHIHDFGTFDGLPYFTMEYVDGGSLGQALLAEPMGIRDAAALVEVVARAMQVVHDRHIVHRDLKPGNILLTRDRVPKIGDFGLAKRLGSDLGMTVSGTVMGTANYMAPEQARGDRNVTPAVDVYALGAILYECLTGQPPFRSETYEMTIRAVIDEEPLRPRELVSNIPPELEAICLKCLSKEPLQRYPRAVDLADDLKRYLNAETLSIGTFDLIDQHERWARKIGLENLELLGCIPWAFVYRAREKFINRRVKLKLCTGNIGSPAHLRLRRQAEAMAGLSHPNIERLYAYGEANNQPYLLQEYVDGRSFSAIMRERFLDLDDPNRETDNNPPGDGGQANPHAHALYIPVPIPQVAGWIGSLARALQFVHDHHVLHSAIYPGELRVTDDGVARLCSFAAAQKLEAGQSAQEAPAAWVRPNYQPPEQVAGDWPALGPPSDIYALGAVLYELLTGQLPFAGLDIKRTREAVLKELPLAPRNINARIPPYLDHICQRCLAKKPSDRFQSAGELAAALDEFSATNEPAGGSDTAAIDPGYVESLTAGDFEFRIFTAGQAKPARFPLPKRYVAIGRAAESDIVISDEHCSRYHCAVYWDDCSSQHVLVLIKAKHGVKINGESIRGSQALSPGDIIQIASAKLIFSRKDE